MKFGIIVFPGSNCEQDIFYMIRHILNKPAEYIWHQDNNLKGSDCIILPGGFTYGDYLRPGAIARFCPAVKAVQEFSRTGGLVLGICNGFQILVEAGLLPGTLRRNTGLQFYCHYVYLRVENNNLPFTREAKRGQILKMPVAHGEGNYYCDRNTLAELHRHNQIVFRYVNWKGLPGKEANPNGSLDNIAGIVNKEGNILGMMPHPERAGEALLGSTDGTVIFASLLNFWGKNRLTTCRHDTPEDS